MVMQKKDVSVTTTLLLGPTNLLALQRQLCVSIEKVQLIGIISNHLSFSQYAFLSDYLTDLKLHRTK